MRFSDEFIQEFASLFVGRLDAYGAEDGEAIRVQQWTFHNYVERVARHLHGDEPMGVYPLVPDSEFGWVVRWGCVDFDEGEQASLTHARNLHLVLQQFDIWSAVERSRSKGYHVWVFPNGWVEAATMRRALLAAAQIAQAPTKEINPKSEGFFHDDGRMNANKLGNYVRLPYPNGHGDRRVVIRPDSDWLHHFTVEQFVDVANQNRPSPEQFTALAQLYVGPTKPKRTIELQDTDDEELPPSYAMGERTRGLFRLGPFEDRPDRSAALWRLANLLKEDHYRPSETLAFLRDADRRWGKFIARGDGERLGEIVRKVYS